ncbi:hypothetical protein BDV59DRAFT_179963 [Aspergillus ambiguus]|uniref:uncharacterized protein n=1 Tax=Aspergillus ambiguus TaxID=176160 RepID=UPI003CCD6176
MRVSKGPRHRRPAPVLLTTWPCGAHRNSDQSGIDAHGNLLPAQEQTSNDVVLPVNFLVRRHPDSVPSGTCEADHRVPPVHSHQARKDPITLTLHR